MMSRKIALIQPHANGDICATALPIARKMAADNGYPTPLYVHSHYKAIPSMCDYVEVHEFPGDYNSYAIFGIQAHKDGFAPLHLMADGHSRKRPQCMGNFLAEQWARTPYLDEFHSLPLVIDRLPDPDEALSLLPEEDGRPLLLMNFAASTSPYPKRLEQSQWAKEAFSDQYRIFDMSNIRLSNPAALIHLYKRAACLISADTLHVHLSYATKTPLVAMIPKTVNTEPRSHWVYKCGYEESTNGSRIEIARIIKEQDFEPWRLCRPMKAVEALQDKVFHSMAWSNFGEVSVEAYETRRSIALADSNYRIALPSWRIPAETMQELLGQGLRDLNDEDILVFSDSDTMLIPTATNALRRKLINIPCCYCDRVVFDKPQAVAEDLMQITPDHHAILFAARASWWKQQSLPRFHPQSLGLNCYLKSLMKEANVNAKMNPPIAWVRSKPNF